MIVSLLMHPEGFPPRCAVTGAKNVTTKNLDSSTRISGVHRCFVYVARRIAALILFRTRLKSVANV